MSESREALAQQTRVKLWILTGGRCQYRGCGEPLWRDEVTFNDLNHAHIAHIHGVKGARHNASLTAEQVNDIANLMLMCYTHHRLVDHEGADDHPADLLRDMKREHERRIHLVTGFKDADKSEIIRYGKAIANGQPVISFVDARKAIAPRHPASSPGIEVRLRNERAEPVDEAYWQSEASHLRSAFQTEIRPRISRDGINHLSVFAIAPQPLLVLFGHLLSAMVPAEVYPRQKSTDSWGWLPAGAEEFEFNVKRPDRPVGVPLLVLSLSGTITTDRLAGIVPEPFSVWEVTIPNPNTDFLRHRYMLTRFCDVVRRLLDEIKRVHGHHSELHVFPAAPVAACVEFGRQHTPTADLPMVIYNENPATRRFERALRICAP